MLTAFCLVVGACTPTPAPAPVPESTPAPAPVPAPEPSPYTVGETVDIGKGASLTVESFEKRENLGFITLLIDNSTGSEDIKVDFLSSFLVEDKAGRTAQINFRAERDYPAPDGTVPAGDELRGTLVYELAPLGEGLTLLFSHDISAGYVTIALE